MTRPESAAAAAGANISDLITSNYTIMRAARRQCAYRCRLESASQRFCMGARRVSEMRLIFS